MSDKERDCCGMCKVKRGEGTHPELMGVKTLVIAIYFECKKGYAGSRAGR